MHSNSMVAMRALSTDTHRHAEQQRGVSGVQMFHAFHTNKFHGFFQCLQIKRYQIRFWCRVVFFSSSHNRTTAHVSLHGRPAFSTSCVWVLLAPVGPFVCWK